jgi:hypothetical protein
MTQFGNWKHWLSRILGTRPLRARRRLTGDRRADLGISLEALESRELLSADAMLNTSANFGSAGAAGHDVTFGCGMNPAFGGRDRGFEHESSQAPVEWSKRRMNGGHEDDH